MIVNQVQVYADSIEVSWVDEFSTPVKCRSYMGDQLSELRVDLGVDLEVYEQLIQEFEILYVPPPPPPVVIADVTPRQIRMALTRAGLRAQVEAAVAAGDQDLKDWYEFSTTFQRAQPLVAQMGTALGQTSAQLDALWQLAATL